VFSGVELFRTVVGIASLAGCAFLAGAVQPFNTNSFVQKVGVNVLTEFDDCAYTFMADDGIVRTPS
jgi:hypothetical protein